MRRNAKDKRLHAQGDYDQIFEAPLNSSAFPQVHADLTDAHISSAAFLCICHEERMLHVRLVLWDACCAEIIRVHQKFM